VKARSFGIFVFLCMLAASTGDYAPASPVTPTPSATAAVRPIMMAGAPPAASPTAPPSKPNTSANTTGGKDVCLECHGPFDDLTNAPITFAAENGDKINPHRHVPHNRTDAQGVVECTKCHHPHPLPLTSKAGLPKANAYWCYSCHHTHEFLPCKTCHQ
jgi:predicted CXXCH cytochrome family protein